MQKPDTAPARPQEKDIILRVDGLTKMFGSMKLLAREMLRDGRGKEEILKKTGVTVAVDDVFFEVERGRIFSLIGLSGSGKSTVVRCLNLLLKPTAGHIYYEGEDIAAYSPKQLLEYRREHISMVFQSFGLLSHRNVLENVAYGLEARGVDKKTRTEKAMEMIAMVNLEGWEYKSTQDLSGGMRQRVGLARALANNPDILLMDEPFSALDPLVRRDMQFEMLSIQEKLNKTIVFITHDINEAFKLGNTVSIMQDGKIIQTDTPEKMAQNPANEYVRDFINSADKSQIYNVRNFMQRPSCLVRQKEGAQVALKQMRANDVSSAYVVNDRMKFVGVITLDAAFRVRAGEITFEEALINDMPSTTADTQISDLIPIASHAKFPIAVLDDDGRLQGIISKAAILTSLT
ncbi:MAG: glycine betaine/L-proline ABC transporter ATP-binding protein [Eubacteriales bacterium]|nr:glycine betaine/L-proline ABC transporter ATP-binding protein [Eubacteriales bacterium]